MRAVNLTDLNPLRPSGFPQRGNWRRVPAGVRALEKVVLAGDLKAFRCGLPGLIRDFEQFRQVAKTFSS